MRLQTQARWVSRSSRKLGGEPIERLPETRSDGIVLHQDLVLRVLEFDIGSVRQAVGVSARPIRQANASLARAAPRHGLCNRFGIARLLPPRHRLVGGLEPAPGR